MWDVKLTWDRKRILFSSKIPVSPSSLCSLPWLLSLEAQCFPPLHTCRHGNRAPHPPPVSADPEHGPCFTGHGDPGQATARCAVPALRIAVGHGHLLGRSQRLESTAQQDMTTQGKTLIQKVHVWVCHVRIFWGLRKPVRVQRTQKNEGLGTILMRSNHVGGVSAGVESGGGYFAQHLLPHSDMAPPFYSTE